MKSSRDSLPDKTEPFTPALVRVLRATKAGALYAIIVFLIGFIFGTVRVLLVAPRLGETTAVIVEIPIMLAASWFVCRWCVVRLDIRLAGYGSPSGAIGLAAQVIFAMFLVIQVWPVVGAV